jgi:hypothetical protein
LGWYKPSHRHNHSYGATKLIFAASGRRTITVIITSQTSVTKVSSGATKQGVLATGITTIIPSNADIPIVTTSVDVSVAAILVRVAAGFAYIFIADQIIATTTVAFSAATILTRPTAGLTIFTIKSTVADETFCTTTVTSEGQQY